MTGKSADAPKMSHNLGSTKIQAKHNRLTMPDSLTDLDFFDPEKPGEVAHWGYDPEMNLGKIANDTSYLNKHRKTISVGSCTIQVPKDFFSDFKGHKCGPVKEVRLELDQKVYFITTQRMIDSDFEIRSAYVVPADRLWDFYENLRD